MDARANDKWIFETRSILGWLLFTFSAGFVNAAAVMACQNFVAHITGNVTNIAVESTQAASFILVVAMFIGGAMAAYLLAETLSRAGKGAAFVIPVLLSFTILIAIGVTGKSGAFGAFGSDHRVSSGSFTMLALLAAALGMVNAAVANVTRNQIRITHLTGPATDLAGNLVRALLDAGEGTAIELRWAILRLTKVATFAGGAVFSVRLAPRLEYDVFCVAALFLVLALAFASGSIVAKYSALAQLSRLEEGEDAIPLATRYEDGMPPLPSDDDERPK